MNRASSEISKSHSFDVIDGLADCSCWYSSMEGPLTRISKIAIVNTLGAKDLCRILFGTRLLNQHAKPFHGRSLLSGRWMKEGVSCILLLNQYPTPSWSSHVDVGRVGLAQTCIFGTARNVSMMVFSQWSIKSMPFSNALCTELI